MDGGFVSDVVRIEDTVRRAPSPNSGFVQDLLRLFENSSWPAAPRFHGIDDHGREILSFMEGHVPLTPAQVRQVTTDQSLTQVAVLVRAFHDLTAGTPLAADQEVVCHNDLSPKNTVYRDDGELVPIAFIDWDLAGPGSRVHDVAHVCWQYLRLGDVDPHWAGPRLRLVCDAYDLGDHDRERLVATVLWWQDRCWRGIEEQAAHGVLSMQRLQQAGVPAAIREAHARTDRYRQTLETYL
jgi:aminoglycoside phosphotransferase (APT) family kinase protein